MKLIIQIPCYNEEENLPKTIGDLPTSIEGIDTIEYMVVDDGSSDRTVEVARKLGVHHIIQQPINKGLARTFMNGVEHALRLGADIIVNTDGDNQYYGGDIKKLVVPILEKQAEIVVGSRPIKDHPEFNPIKKVLQLAGSAVLRKISKTTVRDAASGFRAFSRNACMKIYIHSTFSYCMETLIQAGNSGLTVVSVDIRVNPKTRESRLFSNNFEYVFKSALTMLIMFLIYRPGSFFCSLGAVFFAMAFVLGLRFLALTYIFTQGIVERTYFPSLILLSIFASFGMMLVIIGMLGEIFRANRRVTEEILLNQRKQSLSKQA